MMITVKAPSHGTLMGYRRNSSPLNYRGHVDAPRLPHPSQPPFPAYPPYPHPDSLYSYPQYGLPFYPSMQSLSTYPQRVPATYLIHPYPHVYPTHPHTHPIYSAQHPDQPAHCQAQAHEHITLQTDNTYTCHTPERDTVPGSPSLTHSEECPHKDLPKPPTPMEAHSHIHASLVEQIEAHKKERMERRAKKKEKKQAKSRKALDFEPNPPLLREVPLDAQWEYFTSSRLHETRDLVRAIVAADPLMQERMQEMNGDGVAW
ncbi:hypothetical protein E2C01_097055 [Portunus trituberculatus]|uniref:Uncharacterized protein n=1 Tax=Portunus trituberculatus TaxID=210409 RepID=A0A5B7JZF6_PORTR|nr:hypothetical protein [Portunus trituberculatus]